MHSDNVYLRNDVAIELLIDDWYAWPYLLSPSAGAMCVANAQLKIMQSFVSNPQLHVSALKNPAMRGGPFVDYDASRANEVKQLLQRSEKSSAHLVAFAEAVKTLERILAEEANGQSLEPLYEKVPDVLRGYVELVYDLNHHPAISFLEGLLYHSEYATKRAQSIVLSKIDDTARPFVFSTPRLPRPGDLRLELPFATPGLDELYRARYEAQPLARLTDLLHVRSQDTAQLATFFTADAPPAPKRYEGQGVRVRYFGHACVLIESRDVSILVDPIISHDYESGTQHFSHADLPPVIDYVLITHNHQDHCLLEPLLELRHRIRHLIVPESNGRTLIDPSLKRILQSIGFNQVMAIGDMEEIPVKGGIIRGLPFLGEHGDLDIQTKLAYHVTIEGQTVLLMADSNNLEPRLYDRVHKVIGDVDALFIGMECEGAPMSFLYGSYFTKPLVRKIDQSRRLDGSNFPRARDIVDRFNPKSVYVYAMGQEPWLRHLMSLPYTDQSPQIVQSNLLLEHCRGRGIVAERPYCHKEIVIG